MLHVIISGNYTLLQQIIGISIKKHMVVILLEVYC